MWYVILSLIIAGLILIVFNLYNQVTQLEAAIEEDNDTNERALRFYTTVLEILSTTLVELDRVDKRGSFSSDDEVGFTFRVIKETVEQTKYQLEQLIERDNTTSA